MTSTNQKPVFELEFRDARITGNGMKAVVILTKDGNPEFGLLVNPEKPDDQEMIIEKLKVAGVTAPRNTFLKKIAETRTAIADSKKRPLELKYANEKYIHKLQEHMGELVGRGRFLITPDQRTFYSNGAWPEPILISKADSSPLRLMLAQEYKINRHDEYFPRLVEMMDTHTHLNGEKVEIFQLSRYDPETNVMSIYMGDGNVLKTTADHELEIVKNGETGVLLESSMGFEPWEYVPPEKNPRTLVADLIDSVSFDDTGDTPLTVEDMRLLALIWLISTFFRAILPTRPIACGVGYTGSGKTEMFRQFGKVLIGSEFDVDAPGQTNDEGFQAAIVNRPYVVYDNADEKISWWPDALARFATGGRFSARKKYSDFEEVSVKPDAMLAITSRTPHFRRIDVASRLLLFYMRPRADAGQKSIAPDQLNRRTAYNRNAYLSELADRIKLVLRSPEQHPEDVPPHMGDFYRLALRIAHSMGQESELVEAFDRLRGVQAAFATEEDVVIQTLLDWLELSKEGVSNGERWISSSALFIELRELAEASGYKWYSDNPQSLGRKLGEFMATGAAEGRFGIEKRRKHGTDYRISKPGEAEKRELL